ncbi:MAG: YciI family protein [Bryobacteraceae bacterium]
MKYAAIVAYTHDSSTIAKARPSHREYLTGLQQQGKLVISGPFSDDRGGLLVYEADTAAEVEKLIAEDPFAIQGVFVSWEVRPWNVVFINRELLCR